MYSVMWNSLCFIITVLIGASHQRATGLETSDTVDYSDTDSIQVFADPVDRWKNLSDIKVPIGSSGLSINRWTNNCQPCKCGVSRKSLGIVGGKNTTVKKYPWMAFILIEEQLGSNICGGSLINNRYVMTAAHCFFEDSGRQVRPKQVTVQLLKHDEFFYTDFNVMKIILHKKYNPSTHDNDIALLRLDHEDLDIGQKSRYHSVCMPHAGDSFINSDGIVTGWGETSENGKSSNVLQEVTVPIISNRACKHFDVGLITNNMMCAGFKKGGKDSCQGDSGGPLHIKDESTYYVVGIVSFGTGCAKPKSPGVYTRVNKYLKWLAVNTEDACSCSDK